MRKQDKFKTQIPSWRSYQRSLQTRNRKQQIFTKSVRYSLIAIIAGTIFFFLLWAGFKIVNPKFVPLVKSVFTFSKTASVDKQEAKIESSYLKKSDIRTIITSQSDANVFEHEWTVRSNNQTYKIETSFNQPLQNYLTNLLEKSYARYIGIVLLNPENGYIEAAVGFDKKNPLKNPCFSSQFPAASLFKIITAAAAIETLGLKPESKLKYNGRKYTLYKSQLKDRNNRYTRHVTLQTSFAQSINPIFGKLGANNLGKNNLEAYSKLFGFNMNFDLELPVGKSEIEILNDPFSWAEIACGFNRKTLISPVHGAMIVNMLLNQGQFSEPVFIKKIEDQNKKIRYIGRPRNLNHGISPRAARLIKQMMYETIKKGTARKEFRRQKYDKVLAKLKIGGKTGSINSRKVKHLRYDWFVGFAEERKGDAQLVLSILVAHKDYIGKRAVSYAKDTIKYYFRN